MQTATSKMTSKYQATIPEAVRKLLHLKSGDSVAFDIEGTDIRIRKARMTDIVFIQSLEGSLGEWNSAEDDEAYGEL